MFKQLNLFGKKAYIATKSHVLYKHCSLGYECFVERDWLMDIRNGDQSTKKELVQKAQSPWKSEVYGKDKEKMSDNKISRYHQQHCFYLCLVTVQICTIFLSIICSFKYSVIFIVIKIYK